MERGGGAMGSRDPPRGESRCGAARKDGGEGDGRSPPHVDYGLIRIPNRITTDAPGAIVPTVAVIAPAAPFAGVTIDPCDVVAPPADEYTVFAGVASLTTTLVTAVVPTFVTVIS